MRLHISDQTTVKSSGNFPQSLMVNATIFRGLWMRVQILDNIHLSFRTNKQPF